MYCSYACSICLAVLKTLKLVLYVLEAVREVVMHSYFITKMPCLYKANEITSRSKESMHSGIIL